MRRFEVREFRPRKLAQLALIGSCAFVENNKGVRRPAPLFLSISIATWAPAGSILTLKWASGDHSSEVRRQRTVGGATEAHENQALTRVDLSQANPQSRMLLNTGPSAFPFLVRR